LRTLEEELSALPKDKRAEAAQNIIDRFPEIHVQSMVIASDFLVLFEAKLYFDAKLYSEAIRKADSIGASAGVGPEAIGLSLEAIRRLREVLGIEPGPPTFDFLARWSRDERESILQTLTPISQTGFSFDNYQTPRVRTRIFPAQRHVPLVLHGSSYPPKIADAYREMGLYRRARQTYLEAIYSLWSKLVGSRSGDLENVPSWLFEGAAPIWLRAAECEWLGGGDLQVVAAFLGKAIVYGNDATAEAGFALLERIAEAPLQTPPPPAPDATKLLEMAAFYVERRLHPRALEILDEFEDAIGKERAAELREAYSKDWLERLDLFCTYLETDRAILFGQNVLPMTDAERLAIRIPYPCEPAALAKVAEFFKNR
jgi:tetratricopeptide (TPR) repeat protein